MPFISIPSTYSSRIASTVGVAASASWRWASISSLDSTRKTPRCPPESAGLSTAGKPTSSAARRRSEIERTAAKRGCGTPASASRRRMATLCVIRCAVATPIPGRPRASATAATTGTAPSALTVRTPSMFTRAVAFRTASTSEKSTTFAMSASRSPSASAFRSTAATRSLRSFAWTIARRWWRPAPTNRTVCTAATLLGRDRGADELQQRVDVDREPGAHVDGDPVEQQAEEADDVAGVDVAAKLPAPLHLGDALRHLLVQLRAALQPLLAELWLRADLAEQLEVDAEPVRVLGGDALE